VSDRNGRSLWGSQGFNLGTELLRERLDDASAEADFWLSKDAVRLSNAIVGDRKLPNRCMTFGQLITHASSQIASIVLTNVILINSVIRKRVRRPEAKIKQATTRQ
jgi:hypothetical protein